MAPNAPTELSQQSIQQIVAGLQQAQGATGLPSRDLPKNNNHITQDVTNPTKLCSKTRKHKLY